MSRPRRPLPSRGAYRSHDRISPDINLGAVANLFIPTLVSLHRWYQPEGAVDSGQLLLLIKRLIGGIVDLDGEAPITPD